MPPSSPPSDPRARYLDPAELAQVRSLELRTRMVVEGFMAGAHRSPYLGSSVEFAQHREYVAGDDIRRVDWKVHARSDRLVVKQYEEETNLRCTLLLDVSASMDYAAPGGGLSKWHYGACLAATLATLLVRQQDAVGLALYEEDLVDHLPAAGSPAQITTILRRLAQAEPGVGGGTGLDRACRHLAEVLPHRGLVIVIGDLLSEHAEDPVHALRRLAHRGHDLAVLHLLAADEMLFPYVGNTRFVDPESGEELRGEPRSLRAAYLEALSQWRLGIERGCRSLRASFRTVHTGERLGPALAAALHARAQAGRGGSGIRR